MVDWSPNRCTQHAIVRKRSARFFWGKLVLATEVTQPKPKHLPKSGWVHGGWLYQNTPKQRFQNIDIWNRLRRPSWVYLMYQCIEISHQCKVRNPTIKTFIFGLVSYCWILVQWMTVFSDPHLGSQGDAKYIIWASLGYSRWVKAQSPPPKEYRF